MHIILLACKLLIWLQLGYKCDVVGLCQKFCNYRWLENVTLIAKSNAMRKSAREKEAELNAVEQQLQDKLLQLSNE